ncbi:DNA-binding response regulator [Cohnella terricola]|uniref:DNA-binding response regulator n=1 Tax=Cohnella terricola TaxID=1289167 RepID=A0A559J8A3_9BACL|nr:DNA-binding response regulator [Cohnella terricola]TVX96119.1 DNA-binding response regulator [Cohnella terricola]
MNFEIEYARFLKKHQQARRGESLRRLQEGHAHGEKMLLENVWWPAFGNFDHLHPEYEVSDFKDGRRFLDFAFILDMLKLDIEIDGFQSHAKEIARSKFSDNLMRQNHLVLDGWKIIRFSYDDIVERPRMCQQILLQFMGRWASGKKIDRVSKLNAEEKDIIRMALRGGRILRPKDVCRLLNVENQKARKMLRSLSVIGVLSPSGSGSERIFSYKLAESVTIDDLGL